MVTLEQWRLEVGQLDEVEYARLAARVQEIEKLLTSGAPGEAGVLLGNFLSSAKSRMEQIRNEEGRSEESEKSRKEKETAMAVQLAEREHRLSAQEKERYAGFMELDYFTKANFEELEEFYSNSWDRLSESGKNQMSVRVWGGIRRHEYSFDELPERMREKESERIYQQLTGAIEPSASLHNVAPQARADFLREYEAGNENAATKILSGDDFAGYPESIQKASALSAEAFSRDKKSEDQLHPSQAETTANLKGDGNLALSGITLCESDTVSVPNAALADSGRPQQKS